MRLSLKGHAQSRPNKNSGFTLTEIAIVLGIIGLILGAVWTAASGVYASTNSTKYARLIGVYVAAVRSYCANNTCSGSIPTLATSPAVLPGASLDATGPALTGGIGFVIPYDIDTTTSAGQKTCIAMASGAQQMGGLADASTAAVEADGQIADTNTTGTCSAAGATPTACQTVTGDNLTPVPNSCTAAGTSAKGFCYMSPIPATICTVGNGKGGATNSLSVAFALTY